MLQNKAYCLKCPSGPGMKSMVAPHVTLNRAHAIILTGPCSAEGCGRRLMRILSKVDAEEAKAVYGYVHFEGPFTPRPTWNSTYNKQRAEKAESNRIAEEKKAAVRAAKEAAAKIRADKKAEYVARIEKARADKLNKKNEVEAGKQARIEECAVKKAALAAEKTAAKEAAKEERRLAREAAKIAKLAPKADPA